MPGRGLGFNLRRRSKASFKTEQSNDTSSEGSNSGSHGTIPVSNSGTITPLSIAESDETTLHRQFSEDKLTGRIPAAGGDVSPAPTARPALRSSSAQSSRWSVSGMTGLGSPVEGGKGPQPQLPSSPYAPKITNCADKSWVYQKVLLLQGQIGEMIQESLDGTVIVTHADDSFPPMSWPVSGSRFKALVHLPPGPSRLRLEFSSPKLANSGTSNNIHATHLVVNMMPPTNSPPLQLAILVAKDSPCKYDAIPARVEREGNGMDTAIQKFRMAAYLWQAFTAEQMLRGNLGRRVFRFEEEWRQGTSSVRDLQMGTMRNEAKIHIIQLDQTVAELRDPNNAQQNPKATNQGALYGFAADAVKRYFAPQPGQKQYVSCMFLDTHWDPLQGLITAHAALGGGMDGLQLAIFGSHCLQSYPSTFEEIVPAFTDCTPTDTRYVANDCNEAGSSWEAANIGIGAHMHETGHLFGCPHQENGVMLRDYVTLNRTFVVREAYSTRTRAKGGLVDRTQECTWHRLDLLRFRSHPCFRLPGDAPVHQDTSVQAWPTEDGNVTITAVSGVSYIEIYGEGQDVCHSWLEYPPGQRRSVVLSEDEVRKRLPENKRKGKVRLCLNSYGNGGQDIQDIKQLFSRDASIRLGSNPIMSKTAYRGNQLGLSQMEGTVKQDVIFTSALKNDRVMSRIIFYHGSALDGLEFVYDNGTRQLFGKRGGKAGGDVFELDIRRGEYISGFLLRAGFWIDGIQILTSLGRRSPIYGNAHGGSAHTLIPPPGYRICGVSGSAGAWVDGFAAIIVK